MYLDILLFAIFSVYICTRLFNVLGRINHEPNPVRHQQQQEAPRKVVDAYVISPSEAALDQSSRGAIVTVKAADQDFDLDIFIQRAKRAYSLIIEAIASGQRHVLQTLVSPEIYKKILQEIERREESGMTLRNRIVRIRSFDVLKCNVENNIAKIETEAQTDQIWVLMDQNANVMQGSEGSVIAKTQKWVFMRNLTEKSNTWILTEMN